MDMPDQPKEYLWNFEIDADPVCKNGWKTTSRGFQYKPHKVRNYEESVKNLLSVQAPKWPLKGSLVVRMVFHLPRPSSHYNKGGAIKKGFPEFPTKRSCGDLDNLCKGLSDAMNGLIWEDDSQVIDLHLYKRYAPQGKNPRIIVGVEPLEKQIL